MTLEVRMTDDERNYLLADAKGPVGYLYYSEPDEEDPAVGWVAVVYSAKPLGGERTSEPHPTAKEAVATALAMYAVLIEERREMNRFYRANRPRVVSIPMGGAPPR